MSAPELPPITGRKPALLSNGYSRSYSFHQFTDSYYSKRNSVHSDSSLQRFRIYSKSQASSSSSQASRGRVLSAGTDRRANGQATELPKDPLVPSKPLTSAANPGIMRSVPNKGSSPSCVSQYENKKTSKVKDMTTPARKHTQSTGDTPLMPKVGSTNGYIKRVHSDKNLKDNSTYKKSSKHTSKSVKSTQMNGMRKSHSAVDLVYNGDDGRSDDESAHDKDFAYDSENESDKDQRVLSWIIGVNNVAEPPEEPLIDHTDEPPQRDTAIRIVYEENT